MTIRVNPASSGGGGGGGGGGTGEFPNFDINGLQGFAMFEWKDWNLYNLGATNRNVFLKDTENAVVVMISKTVVNTIGKNELLVMNPNTKVVVPAVSSTGIPPNNFKYFGFVAGYYIYNATIDTTTLGGNYSISATLTDSKTRPDTFTFNTWMLVLDGTSETEFPTFKTYKGSFSSANEWTHFSVSDQSRNKILVEVQTEGTYPYQIGSGNVEIRDFVWATQVKRAPASTLSVNTTLNNWNGPVSNLWQVSAGNGIYRFVINLANCTSGAEWLPMNHAYILRFDVFKTTGETFLLTKVIYIDAPTTKYDIVTGVEVEGGAAWNAQATLFYYENDNSWTPPIIMEDSNDRKDNIAMPLRLQGGDINGDGIGDFVALLGYGSVNGKKMKDPMVYPTLYMGTGTSFFKITLPLLGPSNAVMYLDLGNVDQDDDMDLVIAYNNAVYLYRNDGAWTRTTIASGLSGIIGVRVADMDAPSTTGNDPIRSKDIVIVTTASIMVCQNKDGAGTFNPADRISLQPDAGTTPVSDWVLTEETIYGRIASGDLTNTRGEATQYNYEELWEKDTIASVITYPKITGTGHTAGETLSDMWYNNDSLLYTILQSRIMNITSWDHTGLGDPQGEIDVNMVINYSASGYSVGESVPLQYFNDTTGKWVTLATFGNGAGYLEIPLDFINVATDLIDLNVRFVNSPNGTLNLDVMSIRVDYPSGDKLEHIWAFTVTAGTGYKFNLFTAINASTDGDAFKFQYSKDKITWTDIVTVNNTGPLASITPINLAAGLGGPLYVRVISTGSGSSTPSNDWIKVGQMYISCTATLSKIGKSIQAFDIGDLDGDGSNDIVVCTLNATSNLRGDVWTLYNRDYYATPGVLSSGIFDPDNIKFVLSNTNLASNVKNIEIGRFFGNWNDTYLDLVIRKNNYVYYVDQTTKGYFTGLNSLAFVDNKMAVDKMMVEDIDGNGRSDLVFGTSTGDIILWANYGGTTTYGPWAGYTWQRYAIDNLGQTVNDISGAGVAV